MTFSTLRKTLALIALCLIGSFLFGQRTEIRVNAFSGIFSFFGSGSTSASTGYLNPYGLYGRRPGFSYSFELQVQQVTKQKHLFGLGISLEKLRSKAKTTLYATDIITGQIPMPPETGATTLTNTFITLNPFIGQRFLSKVITMDALLGLDLAYSLKSFVVIKMFTSGRNDSYSFAHNEITPSVDVRPRVQINANYKNFGLLVGYSLGLTNYQTKLDSKAYAKFFRIGISYKLK
jgi:hypothetical protein